MGQRLLLNLLLAVMVAGLAALAWLTSNQPVDTGERRLSHLSPESVTRIHVTRPGYPDLSFTRSDNRWLLAGEHNLPADHFQVKTILSLLDAHTIRHFPVTGLDLAGMGLDPPQAVVQLRDATIAIGTVDPIDQQRYVRAGDTVFLLTDRYQHLLNAGPHNFIERRLFRQGSEITGLRLPGVTLSRGADNRWLVSPNDPRIAADDIRELVDRWEHVQALYVTESNEEDPAGEHIAVTPGGSAAPVEFVITAREPDLVLTRPDYGIRYHITAETAQSMLELPSSSDHGP